VRCWVGGLVYRKALQWLLSLFLIRNTYRLYHQAVIDNGMTIVTILTFFVWDGGGRRKQTGGVKPSASLSLSVGHSSSPFLPPQNQNSHATALVSILQRLSRTVVKSERDKNSGRDSEVEIGKTICSNFSPTTPVLDRNQPISDDAVLSDTNG
jgi:hypothetical protein